MLPPRMTPKQHTPGTNSTAPTLSIINKALVSPMSVDTATGRASIARLRSQNAGQVAAKARLFNAFVTDTNEVVGTAVVSASTAPATVTSAVAPVLIQQQHNANRNTQRRQSAAFLLSTTNARTAQPAAITKPSVVTSASATVGGNGGRPSILVAPNVHRIKAAAATGNNTGNSTANHNSPRKSMTPSGINGRRSAARNHLNGIHRRQKLRLAKSPIKRASPMRLKHLIDDAAETVLTSPSRPRRPQPQSHPSRRKSSNKPHNLHTAMDSIVNDSPTMQQQQRQHHGTPVKAMRNSPRLQARSGSGSTY